MRASEDLLVEVEDQYNDPDEPWALIVNEPPENKKLSNQQQNMIELNNDTNQPSSLLSKKEFIASATLRFQQHHQISSTLIQQWLQIHEVAAMIPGDHPTISLHDVQR